MRVLGFRVTLIAAVLLAGLAGGCGKARILYEPNPTLGPTPRFDKTLIVAPFSDDRPDWERVYTRSNATYDFLCMDDIAEALTRAIQKDLAASHLFRKVVLQVGDEPVAETDLVVHGNVRHLYGEFHENWMEFPAVCFLFIGAPFYVPYEYADFQLQVDLRLAVGGGGEVIWERSLRRRWSYGPMTAFQYGSGSRVLYARLCRKLKAQMGAAIRDLDTTLAGRWTAPTQGE